MEKRHTLSPEQQAVLSNPIALSTFLHLLDGEASIDYIVRKTGHRPLETSFYLERMKEVGLVGQTNSRGVVGRSLHVTYEVTQPDVDLSAVVDYLKPSGTLDLLWNKVLTDVGKLEQEQDFGEHSLIKYAQVRVKPGAFEEFRRLMESLDRLVEEQEVHDGEEALTLLLIGYKMDAAEELKKVRQ